MELPSDTCGGSGDNLRDKDLIDVVEVGPAPTEAPRTLRLRYLDLSHRPLSMLVNHQHNLQILYGSSFTEAYHCWNFPT